MRIYTDALTTRPQDAREHAEAILDEHRLERDQAQTALDQATTLRAMFMGALADLGGRAWIVAQAKKHPIAFLGAMKPILAIEARETPPEAVRIIIETIPLTPELAAMRGVLNTPLKLVAGTTVVEG